MLIHMCLQVGEKVWYSLSFLNDHFGTEFSEETIRIYFCIFSKIWIFKRYRYNQEKDI